MLHASQLFLAVVGSEIVHVFHRYHISFNYMFCYYCTQHKVILVDTISSLYNYTHS